MLKHATIVAQVRCILAARNPRLLTLAYCCSLAQVRCLWKRALLAATPQDAREMARRREPPQRRGLEAAPFSQLHSAASPRKVEG